MADAKLGVIRARAKGGLLDARRPVCREPEALRLCGVVRCGPSTAAARAYTMQVLRWPITRGDVCTRRRTQRRFDLLPESMPFPRRVRVGLLQV